MIGDRADSTSALQGVSGRDGTTEELVIDGDRAAQVATLAGTDTGGFLGLPASGKPFRVPILTPHGKDQQIVSERRIYDFTGLLIQIGVLKASPRRSEHDAR